MTEAEPLRRGVAALAALVLAALVAVPAAAAAPGEGCAAPAPVCAGRAAVYRIASFDPFASAVLVAPGLLVTNRHVVADNPRATVHLGGGRVVEAEVIPTAYAGDLVLLRADGLGGGPPPAIAAARAGTDLYTVAADVGAERVRVYPPGRLLLPLAERPLARLHHTAHGQPGNSGGALLDAAGRLVGIVTSGGDGLEEAIPAARLESLRALSGPAHAAASRRLGAAYRACTEALEGPPGAPRAAPGDAALAVIRTVCTATGNRQLMDLAGQAFGRAHRLDAAAALFRASLDQDPNALNSRLSLAITLGFARRHADQVPHLERLLDVLPADMRVLRMAVQAGKWSGDVGLARRALALIETHHPEAAAQARRFLEDDRPPPKPPK